MRRPTRTTTVRSYPERAFSVCRIVFERKRAHLQAGSCEFRHCLAEEWRERESGRRLCERLALASLCTRSALEQR
jgi:hypothetical protein